MNAQDSMYAKMAHLSSKKQEGCKGEDFNKHML